MQKKHIPSYDRCLRAAGATMVEVGGDESCTDEELASAIGPDTAAIYYSHPPYGDYSRIHGWAHPPGDPNLVSVDDAGRIARENGVPDDRRRRGAGMAARPLPQGRAGRRPRLLRRQVLRRPQRGEASSPGRKDLVEGPFTRQRLHGSPGRAGRRAADEARQAADSRHGRRPGQLVQDGPRREDDGAVSGDSPSCGTR